MSSGRARGPADAGMQPPLGWAAGPRFHLVRPVPPPPPRHAFEVGGARCYRDTEQLFPRLALVLAGAAPECQAHTQRRSDSPIAQVRRSEDSPLRGPDASDPRPGCLGAPLRCSDCSSLGGPPSRLRSLDLNRCAHAGALSRPDSGGRPKAHLAPLLPLRSVTRYSAAGVTFSVRNSVSQPGHCSIS